MTEPSTELAALAADDDSHHPRWRWIAPLALLVFAIVPFADVLFVHLDRIAAASTTDITLQFIAWRTFGFDALRHGHLPLWNPHIYGGAPYFAGFQSALLYPPNWLHLILPIGAAINWLTALHVFLAGFFTFLWCRHRRLSPLASLMGGVMFMFCGPFFPHIFAGHLPHVAVIAWLPLIFLAIDGLADDGRWRWLILGSLAIAATILAGHPQYVYYTGIAASIYLVRRLFDSKHRARLVGGFIGMYVIAVALTAIQLLPGINDAAESVRSGGLPKAMAATFSLPPENLLTSFAPRLLGAPRPEGGDGYFGRTYLWETSTFLSVTGLILAALGLWSREPSPRRGVRTMLIACLLLALGRHTPLYDLMLSVPKYDSFRGTTKFGVFVALFASLLAATGFDDLRRRKWRAFVPIVCGGLAIAIAVLALLIRQSGANGGSGFWADWMASLADGGVVMKTTSEMFTYRPRAYHEPEFLAASAATASTALLWSAALFAIAATVLLLAKRWTRALMILPVVLIVEMLAFAISWHATTTSKLDIPPEWSAALAGFPKDQRVLVYDMQHPNTGMALGFDNIWGYDPGVLKRYAELLYRSQGRDPSKATQDPPFFGVQLNPTVLPMLRCGLIIATTNAGPVTQRLPGALPIAMLVHDSMVLKDRDQILNFVTSPSFEPRTRVVFETPPPIEPQRGNTAGEVKIVRMSSDELELQADTDSPAVLFITNNFANGWRARSLDASPPQQTYTIQPANWAFQGIALQQGKHHILLEYSPSTFRIGRLTSAIALLSLLGVAAAVLIKSRRAGEDVLATDGARMNTD